jgi:carbamoyltransferase
MIRWGISALAHDAALAVFDDEKLLFASHAERYSGIKNDKWLNQLIIDDALKFGKPWEIHFYENPWIKKTRQAWAGQWDLVFNKPSIQAHLEDFGIKKDRFTKFKMHSHHKSHAAAGYFTSVYKDATVIVIDSIGEWECLTVWEGKGEKLKKIYSQNYPHSVGLWYSAMTQRVHFKPNEEEYILMGMSALGDRNKFYGEMKRNFFDYDNQGFKTKFNINLHRGCQSWLPEANRIQDLCDLAAATQALYEENFERIIKHAWKNYDSKNLVLVGGCALNCVANPIAKKYYKNVWIVPNPGDAGSAVGCVLDSIGRIEWPGPYLGYDIEGEYPVWDLIQHLDKYKIVGVANGRAEFGPRALGHRSLLADPRGPNIKDTVNAIKHRQEFRPFAPAILEEHVSEYFDTSTIGTQSPYMQYTAVCKRPDEFPAIVHVDNTSRIQTVGKSDSPGFRALLEAWYAKTGCPMLLNTSLNIKGKPMVNNEQDAKDWTNKYGVTVLTKA